MTERRSGAAIALLNSMNLWAKQTVGIAVIMLNLSTAEHLWALGESHVASADSYVRLEHAFVLSSKNEVTVYCDAGDTLITGSCEARAQNIVPDQIRYLYDVPHRSANRQEGPLEINLFESRELTDDGRTGFACRVKIVRADQELRVTAALKCRKANDKAQKNPVLRPGFKISNLN